jgi:hypothetical protein
VSERPPPTEFSRAQRRAGLGLVGGSLLLFLAAIARRPDLAAELWRSELGATAVEFCLFLFGVGALAVFGGFALVNRFAPLEARRPLGRGAGHAVAALLGLTLMLGALLVFAVLASPEP